jgi:type II secretory pathway component GspD/PulD (secretin)
VQKGDNLQKIAAKYNVSADEIASLNSIKNKNVIVIGSTLEIPQSGDSSETVSKASPSSSPSPSPNMPAVTANLLSAAAGVPMAAVSAVNTAPLSPSIPADQQSPEASQNADGQYAQPSETPKTSKITVSHDSADTKMSGDASNSQETAGSSESGDSLITMNIVEADVRDVLSAIALNMGRNIVFKGTPSTITVKIAHVPAEEALDYVAKLAGLIYVDKGDVIIVGSRDAITADFSDQVEIAQFNLKYITAETLSEQIQILGIQVKGLSVKSNNKTMWVQGFPSDLVKIRQVIRMLDKNENIELGSAEIKNNFRPISVEYISAAEFKAILEQLNLPSGFTLDGNPDVLYVYASSEDFESINSIKSVVDVVDNYSIEGSYFTSGKIELYKLSYITADSVLSLFDDIKAKTESSLQVGVISTKGMKQAIWLCGSLDAIAEAKSVIAAVDVSEMDVISTFEVFRLYNITAAEMDKKLKMLADPQITVYTFPFAPFSKSILISCPGDYMSTVSQMIDQLDQDSPSVMLPVDSSDVEDGVSRLASRRNLISELSGIPIINFKISSNIAKDDGYRYVMYLTASPEDIQRVKDIIAEIDGV